MAEPRNGAVQNTARLGYLALKIETRACPPSAQIAQFQETNYECRSILTVWVAALGPPQKSQKQNRKNPAAPDRGGKAT
eukprot:6029804-Prymnesium_polylepis.1